MRRKDVIAFMKIDNQEGELGNTLSDITDVVYERYENECKCPDDGVVMCAKCGHCPADLPGDLCPGCAAYEEHCYSC